jgi:hypothetical protein
MCVCVCVCIRHSVEKLAGKNKWKKIEEEVNAACQGHLSDGLFGHAWIKTENLSRCLVWTQGPYEYKTGVLCFVDRASPISLKGRRQSTKKYNTYQLSHIRVYTLYPLECVYILLLGAEITHTWYRTVSQRRGMCGGCTHIAINLLTRSADRFI